MSQKRIGNQRKHLSNPKRDVEQQLHEERQDTDDFNREMEHYFGDDDYLDSQVLRPTRRKR